MKQRFDDGHVPVPDNTVNAVLRYAVQELTPQYGADEATAMASALMEHYAGIPGNALRASLSFRIHQSELIHIYNAVQRLKANEPLQYITGVVEFYHSRFVITPAVLIPRPETEELVHIIITENRDVPAPAILDIGTGSGCIAISLARYLPGSAVHALDISDEALQVAKRNAGANKVTVQWYETDILQEDLHNTLPAVDIIVSNPPYIARAEQPAMPQNVTAHEPHTALFVPDDDPLVFYRAIARLGHTRLTKGGKIYAEINEQLGSATVQVFRDAGYPSVTLIRDLSGKERFIRVG